MAVAFTIARRLTSFGEGSPIRHPDLFYVGLSHAGRGTTPDQGGYEEYFLAWVRRCSGGGGGVVTWSTVCRPVAHGGLGVCHLQHTNATLLSKWVIRVMKRSNDMVSILLCEVYVHSLD